MVRVIKYLKQESLYYNEPEMKSEKLFNISPPETIIFNFRGNLGRASLTWLKGQWIITNQRLIFVSDNFSFPYEGPTMRARFGRPLALIILLNEITDFVKKSKKLMIQYRSLPNQSEVKKMSIGLSQNPPNLIDQIYDFLSKSYWQNV